MPFNKLSFLNPLREEGIHPPFSEIEKLVMAHEPEKRSALPFLWPMVELAAFALLVAFLFGNASIPMHQQFAASSARQSLRTTPAPVIASHNTLPSSNRFASELKPASMMRPATLASNDATVPVENGNVSQSHAADNAETRSLASVPASSTPQHVASPDGASNAPSVSPILSSTPEAHEHRAWEAFVSGAFVVPPSNIPSGALAEPFNAAVGIRYALGGPSSILVEIRKNSFVNYRSTSRTTLTDTTMLVEGQPFQNVIGKTTSTTAYSSNAVASLDVGYRFTLNSDATISPYAEALVGGSFSGMLFSGELGAAYTLSEFEFDLGIRMDRLIAPAILPEQALTFEAGAGFAW